MSLIEELPGFCCGQRMQVVDSRTKDYGVRRRRRCRICGDRESTVEIVLPERLEMTTALQEDLQLLGGLSDEQRNALRLFVKSFNP